MHRVVDGYIVVVALGCLQGVLLAFALLTARRGNRLAGRLFAGFLLSLVLDLGHGGLLYSRYMLDVPHLLRVGTPAPFLFGPLLYLYARALAEPDFRLRGGSAWHVVPFALCIVALMPVYALTASEKVQYIYALMRQLPTSSYVVGGLKRVHLGAYLVLIGQQVWAYRHTARRGIPPERRRVLTVLMVLLGVAWGLDLYEYVFDFRLFTGVGLVQIGLLAGAIVLAAGAALHAPRVFTRKPSAPAPRKYATSTLSEPDRAAYRERLRQAMEEKALYQDGSLTLAGLAEEIEATPHQLSQLLNEGFGQNFATFVNSYRVAAAQRYLAAPDHQHLSIAAIAFDAGFNSLSAFNAAFKKCTGTTPSRYRAAGQLGENDERSINPEARSPHEML